MSDDLINLDTSGMSEEEKQEALEIAERAKKLEKETSGHRDTGELGLKIIATIAIIMSVFHLYTGAFGLLIALRQRAVHLFLAIVICMLKFSANKNLGADKEPWVPYILLGIGFWTSLFLYLQSIGVLTTAIAVVSFVAIFSLFYFARMLTLKKRKAIGKSYESSPMWYDYIFIVFAFLACSYIAVFIDVIMRRAGIVMLIDQIFGFFLILTVLEATRRSIGHTLMIIGVLMLIYCRFGFLFPGVFWHPGFQVSMIIRHFILTDSGLWSTPLGVSSTFIAMFLLFGAALHASGLAEILLKIARGVFGHMVGGPAKMAVVASSLFAMISGSSTSNVATTGIVTIPLMKRTGIPAHLAGATEAAASMGGQITPPVMGAVAFIMAEFLGVSYVVVMAAAALPAALYYSAVYSMIHFESHRIGAIGLKKSEIPPWKRDAIFGSYLFIPVIALVYMLIAGFTPMRAGFTSFILSVGLAMIKKETRLGPKKLAHVLSSAAQTLTVVAIPSAIAGFVVGTATLTGLAPRVSTALSIIARDNLFLTLIITQVMCLILGMGVPTVANYILMTILTVPIMLKAGVEPMAAHLFCFHFGIMSELTPPVAITSYTASAIAGAKFWPTAFAAVRLAAVAYIVPYLFVFNTNLLIGQHPFTSRTILTVLTAITGAVLFGSTMAGYMKRKLYMIERVMLGLGAILMIRPKLIPTFTGVGIILLVIISQFVFKKHPKSYVIPESVKARMAEKASTENN
ncbi:MAG: TRAP transporter fused permease subunit [Spirochaetia bacterium]|jgi:TRAP transporter 4TM/12TM fusion protein|nr:TRAP transporter fused permease subunit [Spirochaetia bacterium]